MFKKVKKDRCYIIAEIGGNFNTFAEAQLLIDAAADCGVDAVKLQTYKAETLSCQSAMFDMENTGIASQYDLFKKYEIGLDLHQKIFHYAHAKELDCFSTPSHESDVDLLEQLDVAAHKIGSDDAVNLPFLRYVAQTGKPILLSTGMCTLEEVRESVSEILGQGNDQLILLHAVTSYPTHAEDVNLRAMHTLVEAFPGIDVGYSDHTLSPVACLGAVAMGAKVIERHFTCDKNADGPDHMLSADPAEMKWLVEAVRQLEIMFGNGVKRPADSEKNTRKNNRKSIVLTQPLSSDERLTRENLAVKRPGYGIPPKFYEQLVGKKICRDLAEDTILSWWDLA
ncbi:N-acylneuraminate-9-phosphate synthase [Candidatus Electrothrix gigas]